MMNLFLIILSVFSGLSAIIILGLSLYSGKPLKNLLLNALLGLIALISLAATSRYSGINIQINPVTVVGTAVFSVPAVIGFLVLNIIIL